MSPTRRSRLEIHLKVLELIQSGENKLTHIMYGANTSRRTITSILGFLIKQGLITEEINESSRNNKRTKRRYHITDKGIKTLRYFTKGSSLIELLNAI